MTVRGYQGGGLDGNNSEKLLHLTDELRRVAPFNCIPVLNLMSAFLRITEGCFSWDLAPDYEERIQVIQLFPYINNIIIVNLHQVFRRQYEEVMLYCEMMGLPFTVSWKVHVGKNIFEE